MKARATGATGRRVHFEDGSELEVDAVIWATGYRPDSAGSTFPSLARTGGCDTVAE